MRKGEMKKGKVNKMLHVRSMRLCSVCNKRNVKTEARSELAYNKG